MIILFFVEILDKKLSHFDNRIFCFNLLLLREEFLLYMMLFEILRLLVQITKPNNLLEHTHEEYFLYLFRKYGSENVKLS